MNVIQLQDMLRGLPDDRLKQELSQPTGSVPQYLVLSEVVRRDKMRESAATAPQSTVVQDVIGTPQQAQAQAFANGGFISPAQSMANAGVRGFAPQPPKQPIQFGMNNSAPQMFTPNTTPQPPAPVTNNNINVPPPAISPPQPQFDGGQKPTPNDPSFYEQPAAYADGGGVRSPFQIEGGGSLSPIDDEYASGYGGGAGGRIGLNLPFMGGNLGAGISGSLSGYDLRTEEDRLRDIEAQLSGADISYSRDGRDYGMTYSQSPSMDGDMERSLMFNYSQPFADGGVVGLADGSLVGKIIGAESSYDPKSKNPRSSAAGLGQFIDSTWIQYLDETQPGLVDRIGKDAALKLKEDPDLSTDAVDWYQGKNTGVLKSAGFEPSEGNLYLAHFLGGQGATNILGADPNTPAVDILGEKVVNANPFLRNMKAGDVINWSSQKMGGSQPKPSIPMASMNPADREAGILSGGVMPDPKKRGIGSLLADAMRDPSAMKDMRELGASLFVKGQERKAPEPGPMIRGDASLVKNIGGLSVDQILARYQALREQYMADGGAVRMFDGGPPPFVELTTEEILALTPAQQEAYFRQKDRASQYERGGFKSRHLTEGAAAANEAARQKAEEAERSYNEKIVRGETGLYQPSLATRVEAARELVEPSEEGGPEAPPSTDNRRLMFTDDFRATPNQLFVAAREGERARKAAAEPSDFEKFLKAYQKSQDDIAAIYAEQAEKEQAREAEAGGLPFLLRQLGIGMIATGGPLGEGFRGGLQQAFSAREEQVKAARDRIRELQLKEKMTDIEAASELAKLRYQAAMDAQKAAAEKDPSITNLIALRGQAVQQYNDRMKALEDEPAEVIQKDPVLKGLESQIEAYDIRLGTYTGGVKIEKIGP